jgi:hypothetical protein
MVSNSRGQIMSWMIGNDNWGAVAPPFRPILAEGGIYVCLEEDAGIAVEERRFSAASRVPRMNGLQAPCFLSGVAGPIQARFWLEWGCSLSDRRSGTPSSGDGKKSPAILGLPPNIML